MVFTRSILWGANQLLTEYDKWRDKFSLEVQRSIEMSRGEQPGAAITKLYVTGAGPNIQNLVSHLGEQLGVPVEARDSLRDTKKMPATPSMKDPQFLPVSLTALIGMGLGPEKLEFNLIPDSVRLRKGLMQRARALTVFGILLMAVLATLSTYAMLKLNLKQQRCNELRAAYSVTEPAKQEVETRQKIIEGVRQRGDLRWAALSLLSEVHRQVPAEVTLDSIDIDQHPFHLPCTRRAAPSDRRAR